MAARALKMPLNKTRAAVRKVLIAYLLAMVARGDWHAVSDAANDLRVLEAGG